MTKDGAEGPLFYWQPSASLRRAGFTAKRLPDDRLEAYRQADALNDDVGKWRAGLAAAETKRGTIGWLIKNYKESTRWGELSDRTRRDYKRHLGPLDVKWGTRSPASITPQVVALYRETLTPGRQANMRLQVLSVLMSHARLIGMVRTNPAFNHRRFKLDKRSTFWESAQEEAFLAAADPTMRIAFMLGLWTGQREADLTELLWSQIDDKWINVVQNKTGKAVAIAIGPTLSAELARAPRRGIVVIASRRSMRYSESGFDHAFRKVTAAANLNGFTFLDLRRTAVVRMAEAGATIPEIASITGHSIEETTRILDTYWVSTKAQSQSAINKLEAAAAIERAAKLAAAKLAAAKKAAA